jgi:hypothetical protein
VEIEGLGTIHLEVVEVTKIHSEEMVEEPFTTGNHNQSYY